MPLKVKMINAKDVALEEQLLLIRSSKSDLIINGDQFVI